MNSELSPHDVARALIDGRTVTAVVRNVDDDSVTVELETGHGLDFGEHDDGETFVETGRGEGGTAYVAHERVSLVGTPDTESLHPGDFRVDEHVDRLPEDDEDEQVSTDEALDAVESADGVRSSVLSNNTHAKRAPDGRVFVSFSTSHGYGRTNGVEALKELDDSFTLTYTPHGSGQWAAQCGDGLDRETAEELVEEGFEYVNVRGYHVRIDGFRASGRIDASYPASEFGDSRGEPKREELVDQLVGGTATPLDS